MADEPFPVRAWRLLIGAPRSLADRSIFHRLSLVPFLAWVGLGADGLSSSCYGPEEARPYVEKDWDLGIALRRDCGAASILAEGPRP